MRNVISIVLAIAAAVAFVFLPKFYKSEFDVAATIALNTPQQLADAAPAKEGSIAYEQEEGVPPNSQKYVEALLADLRRSREPASITLSKIMWRKDTTLRVAFNGGSETLRQAIESAAKEWTAQRTTAGGKKLNVRIALNFRDSKGDFLEWTTQDTKSADTADIRIGFDDPDASWSQIGRSNSYVPANEKTMNYKQFDQIPDSTFLSPAWASSWNHRTIVHEFGHAFGFAHEQFHKDCQADLLADPDPGYTLTLDRDGRAIPMQVGGQTLRPGYIHYYQNWPNNWKNPDDVKFQMDRVVYLKKTGERDDFKLMKADKTIGDPTALFETSTADKVSVMLYRVPAYVLKKGEQSHCFSGNGNMQLSPTDVATFDAFYSELPDEN